jgi:hypothetical protein
VRWLLRSTSCLLCVAHLGRARLGSATEALLSSLLSSSTSLGVLPARQVTRGPGSAVWGFSFSLPGGAEAWGDERAADPLHCPGIDSKPFRNDAHTGPSRSRRSLYDSLFQCQGYRRPAKPK